MLKKLTAFVLIFFALYFYLTQVIFAATLRIDQSKVVLSVPPGGVKTGAIKVENASEQPLSVKVYLEDWYFVEPFDGSKEFKPAGTLPLSCADWITFVPAEFTIPPYGRQMVNFTANVPKDATGGHYAVMFFETTIGQQPQEEGVYVNVLGRIGSLLYVLPEGTINKSCEIKNLSLIRKSNDVPLEVNADFHNTGNVYIMAVGTYYIIDKEGIVYARGEFNEVYTLPNDKARLKSSWQENITQGKYDIVLTLDLGDGDSKVSEAEIVIGRNGEVVSVGNLR